MSNLKAKRPGCIREISGHDGYVSTLSFALDGNQFLSGSIDGTIRLWDVATGKEIRRYSQPAAQSNILEACLSPCGRIVLGITGSSTLYLWETETGALLARLPAKGSKACFAADSRLLLVGGQPVGARDPRAIAVLETATGDEVYRLPLSAPLLALGSSENGGSILAALEDGNLLRWVTATGTLVDQTPLPSNLDAGREMLWGEPASFSPDGRSLCLSRQISHNPPRYFADVPEFLMFETLQLVYLSLDPVRPAQVMTSDPGGSEVNERSTSHHDTRYSGVALSNYSNVRLLLGGPDGLIRLWDLESRVEQFRSAASGVSCVALSPNALTAVSGRSDGVLYVWALPEP